MHRGADRICDKGETNEFIAITWQSPLTGWNIDWIGTAWVFRSQYALKTYWSAMEVEVMVILCSRVVSIPSIHSYCSTLPMTPVVIGTFKILFSFKCHEKNFGLNKILSMTHVPSPPKKMWKCKYFSFHKLNCCLQVSTSHLRWILDQDWVKKTTKWRTIFNEHREKLKLKCVWIFLVKSPVTVWLVEYSKKNCLGCMGTNLNCTKLWIVCMCIHACSISCEFPEM